MKQLPLKDGSGSIDISELPDESLMMSLLNSELPPLSQWLSVAIRYYNAGNIPTFLNILKHGASDDLEKMPQYTNSKPERIMILNALSFYYCACSFNATTQAQRDEYITEASQYISKSDNLDIIDKANWISKGFRLLSENALENASYFFNNAQQIDQRCMPAILGKAVIYFNKENYVEALRCYRMILSSCPFAPPNIRLGIGLCHYKLGNTHYARLAFNRVLQLQPNDADALVYLAILDFEAGNYKSYLDLLAQAYQANHNQPLVLMHLARHYLYKEDYVRSMKLANYCLTTLKEGSKTLKDMLVLRAEVNCIVGQCYHAQGDFDNAFRTYSQACKLNEKNHLVQFLLGQMYLAKEDIQKAISCFQFVQATVPDNYETMKILGSLYGKVGKKDQALTFLNRCREQNPGDHEILIELAQLLEIGRPDQALECYESALSLMEPLETTIPDELWNNLGILRHKTGNQEGAEEAYSKAGDTTRTLKFNKARWHEDNGRDAEAKAIYETLDSYSDAKLRLSVMAKKEKDLNTALAHCRDVLAFDKKPINALCQKGSIEFDVGDVKKALDTFNRVIWKHSHHDLYALLSMGNLHYEKALTSGREGYMKNALDYFRKVLSLDERNAYAAVGIGIYLAEMGRLGDAFEAFRMVGDNMPNLTSNMVNLAHIHLLQRRYESAIKLYQKASNVLPGNNVDVYIAFTYYCLEKYDKSIEILRPLLDAPKYNPKHTFNLALCLHSSALMSINNKQNSVAHIEKAISQLEESIAIYEKILGSNASRDLKRLVSTELEHVRPLYEQGPQYLIQAQRQETLNSAKLAEQQKKFEELKSQEEEYHIQLRLQEEEALRRREQLEIENTKRLAGLQDNWRAEKKQEASKKASSKQQPAQAENDGAKSSSSESLEFSSDDEDKKPMKKEEEHPELPMEVEEPKEDENESSAPEDEDLE